MRPVWVSDGMLDAMLQPGTVARTILELGIAWGRLLERRESAELDPGRPD
jgi:hypothetical protein